MVLLIPAALAACKSTPAETPPPQKETAAQAVDAAAPSQDDLASLNAAAERAAKARQMCIDFQAPGYFQTEWASADALYSQAESSKDTAVKTKTQESVAKYNTAADALEALAGKAVLQFAEDQGNELLNARNKAVKAGAEELAEDQLLMADIKGAEAVKLNEAKDYHAARVVTFLARDMYETLETALNAFHLRNELEDRGFAAYDEEAIDAIDTIAESALDDYEAGDISVARSKFENVYNMYLEFKAEWMEVYAGEISGSAKEERQRAMDLKANIAARFDFDTANSLYDRANKSLLNREFEDAANLFYRSKIMFESLSQATTQKRGIAEEALKLADLRMAESDEIANKAEIILEGGN
jgi:hypothetical protein